VSATATTGGDGAGAVMERRLRGARAGLHANGAGALLLGVGADLFYLTGYSTFPTERLTMLVLPADGPAHLIAPRLEAMAAAGCPAASAQLVEVVPWDETDDPYVVVGELLRAANATEGRALVDPGLLAMHVLALQARLPGLAIGLATEVTRELRMAKDVDEVERLRAAARAADRVLERAIAGPLVGRTEKDVSDEIRDALMAAGHDHELFSIVASGPNSASPHHHASDRVIRAGEPIVFDIGGIRDGYGSDITRTVWVAGSDGAGPPEPEFLALYDLVHRANAAATAAVRPGARCGDLDEVARSIIRDGGYGAAFIHRLGHGIGLEGHEEPYLVAGNDEALRPGAAFSIEPGIYLQGRYGARIEDIVVCTDVGPDVLNELPRELRVVAG